MIYIGFLTFQLAQGWGQGHIVMIKYELMGSVKGGT